MGLEQFGFDPANFPGQRPLPMVQLISSVGRRAYIVGHEHPAQVPQGIAPTSDAGEQFKDMQHAVSFQLRRLSSSSKWFLEEIPLRYPALCLLPLCFTLVAAGPDLPLQVGLALPRLLDLRTAETALLVPRDSRDPAQLEAARRAWDPLVLALAGAPSVRLLLPAGAARLPLLLAASQSLKSRNPACRIYVAFDPSQGPCLDDLAWGAVEGGALGPEDLGPDPGQWRDRLRQAQDLFPGRPWTLWPSLDPGARLATLLGDGGRLVLPAGGPGARLAQAVPSGFTEVEGGQGDLTLACRPSGESRRWQFDGAEWKPTAPFRERKEVQVLATEAYDVGALLARMRGAQLRDRAALRTCVATVNFTMHLQGERGNTDLGFLFHSFEKAGDPEELLREKVLYNGVVAKLNGDAQLPIVEARSSLATPVALSLTERYRYSDGGPAGPGQRLLRFAPVDRDPLLASGELKIQEASGRILEERSQRSGLPGLVRSESRVISYGEPAPGFWRVLSIHSTERWLLGSDVTQVLRRVEYRDFQINGAGFEAARDQARASDGSMIQQTLDGARYYTKQKDGTRKAQEHASSSGMGVAGVLLMNSNASPHVMPLAGMAFFDMNAFDRGIQYYLVTAVIYNGLSVTVPNIGGGFDFHAGTVLSALSETDQVVVNGQLLDQDGVQRRSQILEMDLGRELGWGFRLNLAGTFTYDQYSEPGKSQYVTPGFTYPDSGINRFARTQFTWQRSGFQLRSYYGLGQRPDSPWGEPGALQTVVDQGRYQRWGGAAVYDTELGNGLWFQATLGQATGRNFDRFQAIEFDGMVSGMKPHAIVADQLSYGALRLTIPTGPHFRLGLGLDHGVARSQDDQKLYGFTGLSVAGDLPGFWWFTAVNVNLGIGLQSDIPGVRSVNGMITFIRLL